MKIKFEGQLTDEEAIAQLINIFQLFKDKYDIQDFQNLEMEVELLSSDGDVMEIVDSNSLDVVEMFEVFKEEEEDMLNLAKKTTQRGPLSLVVDNTKQKFGK